MRRLVDDMTTLAGMEDPGRTPRRGRTRRPPRRRRLDQSGRPAQRAPPRHTPGSRRDAGRLAAHHPGPHQPPPERRRAHHTVRPRSTSAPSPGQAHGGSRSPTREADSPPAPRTTCSRRSSPPRRRWAADSDYVSWRASPAPTAATPGGQPSRPRRHLLDRDPTVNLLLVEDDARIATFLRKGLRSAGFTVEWVTTGSEALTRARIHTAERPDVMVLDLGLPDLDGLDVLEGAARLRLSSAGGDRHRPLHRRRPRPSRHTRRTRLPDKAVLRRRTRRQPPDHGFHRLGG